MSGNPIASIGLKLGSQKSIIYQYISLDWINGFEREIKRTMSPLGVLRQWSFLNVHLKSAKNFKSPPTAKSTGRGIWKLNRIYIARRSVVSSGSLSRSRKKTGYHAWTQLKFRNSRAVHVHYLPKQKENKKKGRRGWKKMRKLCKPFSLGPIVTSLDEFAPFPQNFPYYLRELIG